MKWFVAVLFAAIIVFTLLFQTGVTGSRPAPSTAVEMLLTAARRGDVAGIERALAAGADVDAREPRNHETALFRAARVGEVGAVEALLRADADPGLSDRGNRSPLHVAAQQGASEVVAVLLAHGAATFDELDNSRGTTPLYEAVAGLHADVARQLLAAGADPNAPSDASLLPLSVAVRQSSLELARLLVEAGADGSVDDGFGPLIHQALRQAQDEDPEMIRLLLGAGARLDQRDREGRTVLEAAREYLDHEKGGPSWVAKRQRVLEALESLESGS